MLIVSGIASLLLSRLVIGSQGALFFATWTTIASLPFLLPISDFGLGAVMTNYSARLPEEAPRFVAAYRKVSRLLWTATAVASVTASIAAALGAFNFLATRTVTAGAVNLGVALTLITFSLSIPGSIGARILVGLRANSTVLAVQGLTSPLTLGLAAVGLALDVSPAVLLATPAIAYAATTWTLWAIARRRLSTLTGGAGASTSSPPIARTAISAAIIGLVLPLAFQSHRVILSITAEDTQVALYSAVALVGVPALSVVQSAGQSFWAEFRSLEGNTEAQRRLWGRAYVFFGVAALLGGAAIVLAGPFVVRWSTADQIPLSLGIFVAYSVMLLAQALAQPAAMLLTDHSGLRVQSQFSLVFVPVAVVLSFVLTRSFGAAGPLLGTAFATVLCMAIPCAIVAGRRFAQASPQRPDLTTRTRP